MGQQVQRWIEVTPSQFTHEAEGLGLIRSLLPDNAPFRAWSNFEFRDGQGKWHEVDLLVVGQRRLHLVELKYYSGTLRGDDLTWLRDGHRAEDSPLKLARRKAQRLASKLQDELDRWAQETGHRDPGSPRRRAVRAGIGIPAPSRSALPAAARHPASTSSAWMTTSASLGCPESPTACWSPRPPSIGRRQPRRDHRQADGQDRGRPAAAARGGVLGHRRGAAGRGRGLAGLARLPPGGHHGPGPDPVPGHPAR